MTGRAGSQLPGVPALLGLLQNAENELPSVGPHEEGPAVGPLCPVPLLT